ncbi:MULTISPECIES: hypothetical protein [Streptomyces]|uniref:DUF2269 family protein n=1 Tax=Streptomyces glycanivorans TaxID=3033808 RepID=A0ABY9JIC8_9ACTN|nr:MULTISPECIES: hypothetical protein [unclassified Streptomyces]WSQ80141.1 hypothetical protein OG725_24930 [Streptomyces sp. NBC_01213]TXS12954.1 hypothetical protein EAO68_20715 [Streptomyces sp. wa22]WLQ66724.1 hypothetical protein P8A20_25515 [Streptomyces sp. Alt3]WSR06516.1 hypothetical protein OG265_11095 [Streptomyces sp. NBC_01208]WSR50821.1 hypothetical protein OG279_25720 [Streptomyces sp. NBC_01201]
MTKLFLSLHVLAVVIAIGPVTVAASMFPRALRTAHGDPGDGDARSTLRLLHRICRVYGAVGIAVPVFGLATAGSLGVLGSGWLITSILLTAAAAGLLVLRILPGQDGALTAVQADDTVTAPAVAARLAMLTGVFNLLWAVVTVLMIIRPGSTTGA